jgi:hypothetical protein
VKHAQTSLRKLREHRGGIVVSTPPDAHETSRLSGTVSIGARWRVSGFRAKVASKQLYPKAIVIQIWVCWLYL